ncbi:MAG TPA: hypothetical protein VGS21_08740 [Acidimicrobiales bacterium]|nr:hypothetical protein [Acidimicrobiales bacterium]
MRDVPGPVTEGALVAPPEVVAAIAAAVEICWPRGGGEGAREEKSAEYVWRFSGRWWNKPVQLRRDRPWAEQ